MDGADFRELQQDSLTNAGKEGFTWEAASDILTKGGASTFEEIEIDSMVLQDNGIGSEHWPEPASECLPVAAPLSLLVLARCRAQLLSTTTSDSRQKQGGKLAP